MRCRLRRAGQSSQGPLSPCNPPDFSDADVSSVIGCPAPRVKSAAKTQPGHAADCAASRRLCPQLMRPLLDTLVANFTLMMEFLRVAPPAAQVRSLPAQLRGEALGQRARTPARAVVRAPRRVPSHRPLGCIREKHRDHTSASPVPNDSAHEPPSSAAKKARIICTLSCPRTFASPMVPLGKGAVRRWLRSPRPPCTSGGSAGS